MDPAELKTDLWITSSEMIRDHPAVGKYVQLNNNPEVSSLRDTITRLLGVHGPSGLQVQITGVLTQNAQIAGYEVIDVNGNTHIGHLRDFTDPQIGSSPAIHDAMVNRVRRAMQHWSESHPSRPREYYGPYWAGIEKMYSRLAPLVCMAAVEAPRCGPLNYNCAWYTYDSERPRVNPVSGNLERELEGKDWRVLLPIEGSPVAVNFQSVSDGEHWTASVAVVEKNMNEIDLDKTKVIGHPDPWRRSMQWVIKTTEILESSGYPGAPGNPGTPAVNYSDVRHEMRTRMYSVDRLHEMKVGVLAEIMQVWRQIHGDAEANVPDYITIILSEWQLPPDTRERGSFYMPPHIDTELGWIWWGTIVIDPGMLNDPARVRKEMIHQLSHSFFGERCAADAHHADFLACANVV